MTAGTTMGRTRIDAGLTTRHRHILLGNILLGTICATALVFPVLNASAQYTFTITSAPASLSLSGSWNFTDSGGWDSTATTASGTYTLSGGPANTASYTASALYTMGGIQFLFCGAAADAGGVASAQTQTDISPKLTITGPIHSNLQSYGVDVIFKIKSRSYAKAEGSPGGPAGTSATGLSFSAFASEQGSQWTPWKPDPKDTGIQPYGPLTVSATVNAQTGVGYLNYTGLTGLASGTSNEEFALGATAYKVWIWEIVGPDGTTTFPEPDTSDTFINGYIDNIE